MYMTLSYLAVHNSKQIFCDCSMCYDERQNQTFNFILTWSCLWNKQSVLADTYRHAHVCDDVPEIVLRQK